MASSVSVYWMTDSTGPKISSCAIVDLVSTSAKIVCATNQPWSRPAGRPPPVTSRTPALRPLAMYRSTRLRCRAGERLRGRGGPGRGPLRLR
jgi:hypothetical protein